MRTFVYVDGFNLYYGALKRTPYRWLDVARMCGLLLADHHILNIKYFTANVSARPGHADAPLHQQIYLRALRTLPDLEIIKGHFLSHVVTMPRADNPGERVRVLKTEEKGSDVNIATHLLADGFNDRFDVAVIVSNDSDLLAPVQVVRSELGKDVGILNPQRHPSKVLKREATFFKRIRSGVLAKSQFANPLTDQRGTFHKPADW